MAWVSPRLIVLLLLFPFMSVKSAFWSEDFSYPFCCFPVLSFTHIVLQWNHALLTPSKPLLPRGLNSHNKYHGICCLLHSQSQSSFPILDKPLLWDCLSRENLCFPPQELKRPSKLCHYSLNPKALTSDNGLANWIILPETMTLAWESDNENTDTIRTLSTAVHNGSIVPWQWRSVSQGGSSA